MRRISAVFAVSIAAFLTAGCGSNFSTPLTSSTTLQGAKLQGSVHGGQQPIAGARVQLYQVGTTGYGAGAAGLIANGGVLTDANGGFNITGTYHCAAGSQVYIVSIGGNPGGGINPSAALMAGLGLCDNLTASTFISVNEVTTVASVWALAPFFGPTSSTPLTNESGAVDSNGINIGAPSTNQVGLSNAFEDVGTLANSASGVTPGVVSANAVVPTTEINTLADILAGCVNSTGSGDGGGCDGLFALSQTANGTTPADTISAALNMARNPGANVDRLLAFADPTAPFQPILAEANDFTIGIQYSDGSIETPASLAVDTAGNVWVANAGSNSVTELSHTGSVMSGPTGFASGQLNAPSAIAIDQSGNVWIANSGNNSITTLNPEGTVASGSPVVGGGLATPTALAFDSVGNLWVTNSGSNSVSEFSSTGTPISPDSGFISPGTGSPVSIAVNPF